MVDYFDIFKKFSDLVNDSVDVTALDNETAMEIKSIIKSDFGKQAIDLIH